MNIKISNNSRYTRCLPWWVLFFTWGGTIAWLSLTSTPPVIKTPLLGWDKFQHLGAYGMLTLFGGRAFAGVIRGKMLSWFTASVVAAAFGVLMEIAQLVFTRNRTAEAGDLLADFTGIAVVYLFCYFKARFPGREHLSRRFTNSRTIV
ncbi:MAG: VanZ family protein [Desulfobacterales bacterium]